MLRWGTTGKGRRRANDDDQNRVLIVVFLFLEEYEKKETRSDVTPLNKDNWITAGDWLIRKQEGNEKWLTTKNVKEIIGEDLVVI